VEMVKAFDVGGETSAVFGGDLDVGLGESRGRTFGCWDGYTSICKSVSYGNFIEGFKMYLQSTPSDAHAASTSGPAPFRKSFSFIKEPLKRTV
jgi:hypothetical protein